MELVFGRPPENYELSRTERELIARARRAVKWLERSFVARTKDSSGQRLVARAVIFPGPLRLDFEAIVPGIIGGAFIGPQVMLDETTFDGNELTRGLRAQMEEAFKHFDEYLARA